MTTLEDAKVTPVVLGGARGGPPVRTLRKDRYWVQPVVTVTVLTAFVAYASWAAFVSPYLDGFGAVRRVMLTGFPPIAGALFQEVIDLAVILNALRALRG